MLFSISCKSAGTHSAAASENTCPPPIPCMPACLMSKYASKDVPSAGAHSGAPASHNMTIQYKAISAMHAVGKAWAHECTVRADGMWV
jgi:hypothetical protein